MKNKGEPTSDKNIEKTKGTNTPHHSKPAKSKGEGIPHHPGILEHLSIPCTMSLARGDSLNVNQVVGGIVSIS